MFTPPITRNDETSFLMTIIIDNGDVEGVKAVLRSGMFIDLNEAFHRALWNNNREMIEFLLEKGADIHTYGDFALREAASNGKTDQVRFFLDKGANVHAYEDRALRSAVGDYVPTEIVKMLLDAGANVHANNDEAICTAARYGRTDVVRLLLKAEGDFWPGRLDDAIDLATKHQHLKTAKVLKSYTK